MDIPTRSSTAPILFVYAIGVEWEKTPLRKYEVGSFGEHILSSVGRRHCYRGELLWLRFILLRQTNNVVNLIV